VINVTVCKQYRDRLQLVPDEDLLDPVHGVLTRVDDHALGRSGGRRHIAVGGETAGGKPSD
jgi:hypothetical protein